MIDHKDKIPEDSNEQKVGGIFNMGIATLERINDILKNLKLVSILPQKSGGEMLIMKLRLIRQLYITALPLIKPEKAKDLNKTVYSLKVDHVYEEGKDEPKYVYTNKKEVEFDNAIILIQTKLQESGNYFMPSSKDPKQSWGNS